MVKPGWFNSRERRLYIKRENVVIKDTETKTAIDNYRAAEREVAKKTKEATDVQDKINILKGVEAEDVVEERIRKRNKRFEKR